MSKAFNTLMPASSDLLKLVAEQLVADRAAVEPLQGQPSLIAIAQIDRELALTLNRLLNQLQEADFSEAALTSDELSHRIRTNYLAALSDERGVVR